MDHLNSNSSPYFWRACLLQQNHIEDLSDLFFRLVTAIFDLFNSYCTVVPSFVSLETVDRITSFLCFYCTSQLPFLFCLLCLRRPRTILYRILWARLRKSVWMRIRFLLICYSICSVFLGVLTKSFEFVLVMSFSFFLWCNFWSSYSLHECVPSLLFWSFFFSYMRVRSSSSLSFTSFLSDVAAAAAAFVFRFVFLASSVAHTFFCASVATVAVAATSFLSDTTVSITPIAFATAVFYFVLPVLSVASGSALLTSLSLVFSSIFSGVSSLSRIFFFTFTDITNLVMTSRINSFFRSSYFWKIHDTECIFFLSNFKLKKWRYKTHKILSRKVRPTIDSMTSMIMTRDYQCSYFISLKINSDSFSIVNSQKIHEKIRYNLEK